MKRISILVLILCVCIVHVAWGEQAAGTGRNWSQFHRPNMSRWNPYENVLNVDNVGSLDLKWSYATGGEVYSSPAVANGVVYVGSYDHNVYALKASTGAKLWSYRTRDRVDSSPAVANGVVYVGSWDHNVYALKAKTGAKLWSYTTGGCGFLARRGERGGLCWVGRRQHIRAERYHRRQAVELRDRRLCGFLARRGEWGGLCWLVGQKRVRAEGQTGAMLWSYTTGGSVDSRPPWRMG